MTAVRIMLRHRTQFIRDPSRAAGWSKMSSYQRTKCAFSSILNYRSRVTYRAHFLRQKDCEMQIRSKAYRYFVSICRSLHELTSPSDVPTPTFPSLAYTAAVLGL